MHITAVYRLVIPTTLSNSMRVQEASIFRIDVFADCLLHLCNVASVTMVDNASIVTRILEFIDAMPSIVSQRIVTALMPLVQISSNLRDNLIMCLRKALFSR